MNTEKEILELRLEVETLKRVVVASFAILSKGDSKLAKMLDPIWESSSKAAGKEIQERYPNAKVVDLRGSKPSKT